VILVDALGNTFNVSNVYGIGCNVNNPNSTIFHFDFSSVVNGQSPYYLISLTGTDSTTVSNQCGKFVHPGDTIAILTVNNTLPISLGVDTTLCATDPLPLLNAGISGASYTWSLNGSVITGSTSQTLQTTSAGSYSVVVSVGPSCSGQDTVNVTVVAVPTVPLSNQSICDYDPLPVLDAQNPGASYQWTLNGNPLATTQTVATTGAGTYAVTITAGSCTGNSSMTLTINPSPNPQLTDATFCQGGSVTLDAQGSPSDSVFWYLGGALVSTSTTLTVDSTGVYIGTLQTSAGCRKSDTATVTVEQPLAAPKVDCGAGGGNLKYLYTWNSIPNATQYEISLDGGASWTVVQPDTFYSSATSIKDLRVKAINSSSTCKDGAASELAPCEVIIPNIITPNGDNSNDVFFIKNLEGHPNSSLTILNRWGNVVLKTSNYQNDWDGGGLSDGAYFYILKLDNGQEYTGNITILKGKK
jgi:gliding motility-associated-like protein